MSTIALCIPAYNAAWCLPKLLRSAKDQAIPFDEILVYNDCSTDNTEEIAIKYGAIVVNGVQNMGCSYGKNKLAEIAKSEWIHFHDADDELLPNFTNLAHKWLIAPSTPDVILFDYHYIDYESNQIISKSDFNDEELISDPIRYAINHQINPFCGLYNRKKLIAIGGYDLDPKILFNEDVAFHCKLTQNNFSFRAEKEVSIINYRIGNSMSRSNDFKCIEAQYEVMKLNAKAVGNKYPKDIALKFLGIAKLVAAYQEWDLVKKCVSQSHKLIGRKIYNENIFFIMIYYANPNFAFWFREKMIRIFKSNLRKHE